MMAALEICTYIGREGEEIGEKRELWGKKLSTVNNFLIQVTAMRQLFKAAEHVFP